MSRLDTRCVRKVRLKLEYFWYFTLQSYKKIQQTIQKCSANNTCTSNFCFNIAMLRTLNKNTNVYINGVAGLVTLKTMTLKNKPTVTVVHLNHSFSKYTPLYTITKRAEKNLLVISWVIQGDNCRLQNSVMKCLHAKNCLCNSIRTLTFTSLHRQKHV